MNLEAMGVKADEGMSFQMSPLMLDIGLTLIFILISIGITYFSMIYTKEEHDGDEERRQYKRMIRWWLNGRDDAILRILPFEMVKVFFLLVTLFMYCLTIMSIVQVFKNNF